jgi:hypothetical protein
MAAAVARAVRAGGKRARRLARVCGRQFRANVRVRIYIFFFNFA